MENVIGISGVYDSDWHEVVRKKKKRSQVGGGRLDVASSVWKLPYENTVSFYFSEFPDTHGAKEMLRAFKLYGEALEVVIPPKRDKWGKRFGFVRFSNVEDSRRFAITLDSIIFGSTKIHVNIPRFQRERNVNGNHHLTAKQQRQPQNHQPLRQVTAVWRKKETGYNGGRKKEIPDRLNVWKTGSENSNIAPKIVYHRKNNIADVCYTVGEDDMKKFRSMYVGTVRTPGTTYSVHEWFSMQGFFSLKVTPLGANKVLLEEMDEGVMQDLMKDYKDWMYEKFDDIRGWEPDVVDNERVVWVRCHGIPVHAWNDAFFASLARNFGEYLGVDEATRTMTTLDVARIRLRSNGYDVFNAVVNANINGSLFPIKIVEEWCGPLQWLENSCCKKNDNFDENSDFDDGLDGEPPLFSLDDDCFKDYDEDGDDGELNPDFEEERDEEYDEVSQVQETIGMHEEKRLENDSDDGGKPQEVSAEGGGDTNNKNVEVENVVGETTHVSNSRGRGGSQVDESVDMVKGKHVLKGMTSVLGAVRQTML